jgi:hypothetical protein
MKSRKLDELGADIDDAADAVDDLQAKAEAEPGADTDTLDDLNETLQHAAETIDDLVESGEDPNNENDEEDIEP